MATQEKDNSGKIFDKEILSKISVFVKPYKIIFFSLIICTILAGIAYPLRPYLIQHAIDKHLPSGNYQGLLNITILLVMVMFLQAILEYFSTYISGWLGQSIIKDVRIKLYQHLLKFRLSFYDRTPIGRLITRNISDVETISDIFTEGLADIAGSILQLTFILGFMFYIDWKLTLISLSVIPFLLSITYVFKEKVKKSFSEVRNAIGNLNSFVQEHITGMNIVQIFNSEQREYQKFIKINKDHLKSNLKSVLYYSIYFPVAEVLSAVGIGLLVWWGSQGVLEGSVTMGTLIAFIMYIQMFFRPIREIADKFNTLQMGIVGSSRVLSLLESTEYIPKNGNLKPEIVKGNVVFDNVWFAYDNENYVLKNISFEVKQGEMIAFVGATGAGKSSIINLLNRFYEVDKGSILIDNEPIGSYDMKTLRSNIGVVMQDVFLFSDSIHHNIDLGNKNITLQKIVEAAEAVGAKSFIEKLPNGFEYQVMERGATLSVGQRQLISFVRAMAYNPKIIVLDEATSSVDSETEELIQNAMTNLLKGRTSIVIAHRLSTIQNANKIIVLDKGEIKEIGTHQQLMALDGFYANLNAMQFSDVVG